MGLNILPDLLIAYSMTFGQLSIHSAVRNLRLSREQLVVSGKSGRTMTILIYLHAKHYEQKCSKSTPVSIGHIPQVAIVRFMS